MPPSALSRAARGMAARRTGRPRLYLPLLSPAFGNIRKQRPETHEAVAHTAGADSGEGELIQRSLENTLVHYADHAYWHVLERAGKLDLSGTGK